ncbi:MAG: hypothetical protein GXO74_01490 [Calditrichaeota bacterium]|nr:hypothetical protein [Calditrichota bacterium]
MTNIEQFIRDLNKAWLDGRYDDLYDYYDNAVVMLPPGSSTPIVGIEPMVESYRKFGSSCTIHKFAIAEITLYSWKKVAMCHLKFEIDYEIKSGRFREEGLEIYAIDTSGAKPKVVWRTQLTLQTNA